MNPFRPMILLICTLFSGLVSAAEIAEPVTLPSPSTTLEDEFSLSDLPSSVRTTAFSLRWSLAGLSRYEPSLGNEYASVFGSRGVMTEILLDQFLMQSQFGSVTAGLTAGAFYDSGTLPISQHTVTLVAFPVLAHASYRFEFVQRQLLIPFVRLGAGGWYYRQRSSDPKLMTSGWAPVASASIGTDLLLDFFLWDYSKWMDQNFGVNWTLLTTEFQWVETLTQNDRNFSHWQMNIGVRFEF